MNSLSKPSQPTEAYVLDPAPLVARILKPGLTKSPEQIVEETIAAAEAQAESIRQKAWQAGYNEGIEQATLEWSQKLQRLTEEVILLQDDMSTLLDSYEPEIVKLSLEIASKIVAHEVSEVPETILDILRLALRQLKDRSNVRIWVNKADLEAVRAARDDIADWVEGLREVEISEDRRVEKGGVIIESSDGVLDARPSSQIDEISRRLEEAA